MIQAEEGNVHSFKQRQERRYLISEDLVREVRFGTLNSLSSLGPLLLGLFSLGKTRLQGDLIVSFQYLTRAYKKDGERLSTRACSDRRKLGLTPTGQHKWARS